MGSRHHITMMYSHAPKHINELTIFGRAKMLLSMLHKIDG